MVTVDKYQIQISMERNKKNAYILAINNRKKELFIF